MLLPISSALSWNFSSHTAKQYSDIFGIFERSGRIFAPAGIIWSVVILSPTLRLTPAFIVSARGCDTGNGLILGPLNTSTLSISSAGTGAAIILSLIVNFLGSFILGILPRLVGSVNTPVSAETAAVSGDTR